MRKRFNLVMLTLALAALLAGGAAIYGNVSAGVSAAAKDNAPVFDFQDHGGVFVMNPQNRGTSDLVRTVDGISMNIDTTDLPVGIYSSWWIVFNNPAGCSDGECGENDVLPPPGTAEAEVSVFWATGGIVGPDRGGHFSASVGVGKDAPLGQVLYGDGVTNPMGAEVHIIVRYHGPVLWGDAENLKSMMTTFQGYCTPESSLGVGTEINGFDCFDPQATIHLPSGGSMTP